MNTSTPSPSPGEAVLSTGDGGIHTVMLLFLIIGIGAALKLLLRRFSIPYTTVLFLLGLVAGVVARSSSELQSFVSPLAFINPNLIQFVFLPVLIFESAFSFDGHVLKRTLGQGILLAGPGLFLATALTACFAKPALPYGWDWNSSLMFGGLLSATDPVSVVALLKELGASKPLTTIIEAESLLNDGTSFVVFSVFRDAFVQGSGSQSIGSIIWRLTYICAGSPVLGFVIGIMTIAWMDIIKNDAHAEIAVSLSSAYMTYYIADQLMSLSGVLAVVALGVYMSTKRSRISPEVDEFLHRFWGVCGYIANTVIFILVGLIVAEDALTAQWQDWLFSLALYLILNIVRYIMVLCFFPALRHWGYGMDLKEVTFISWAGLRGAMSMTLALNTAYNPDIPSDMGKKMLFHTSMTVVLTLLVNGTFSKQVLKYLNLDKPALSAKLMKETAKSRIRRMNEQSFSLLKSDRSSNGANWRVARELCHANISEPESKEYNQPGKKSIFNSFAMLNVDVDDSNEDDCFSPVELDSICYLRVTKFMKASFWRQYNEGQCARGIAHQLSLLTEEANDQNRLVGFHDLENFCMLPFGMDRYVSHSWRSWGPMAWILQPLLFFGYDLAISYCCAMEEVLGSDHNIVDEIVHIIELADGNIIYKNVPMNLRDYTSSMDTLFTANHLVLGFNMDQISMPTSFSFLSVPSSPINHGINASTGLNNNHPLSPSHLSSSLGTINSNLLPQQQPHHHYQQSGTTEASEIRRMRIARDMEYLADKVSHGGNLHIHYRVLSMVRKVLRDAAEELNKTMQLIQTMRHQYPALALVSKTKLVTRTVLLQNSLLIDELFASGDIDEEFRDAMQDGVQTDLHFANNSYAAVPSMTDQELFREIPWLRSVDESIISSLFESATTMNYERYQRIAESDHAATGIILVCEGLVKIREVCSSRFNLYGPGTLLNEISVLVHRNRQRNVDADTPVRALFISAESIHNSMQECDELRRGLWKSVAVRVAFSILCEVMPYSTFPPMRLKRLCDDAKLFMLDAGSSIEDKAGSSHRGLHHERSRHTLDHHRIRGQYVLVSGSIQGNSEIFKAPMLLPVGIVSFFATKSCCLLFLSEKALSQSLLSNNRVIHHTLDPDIALARLSLDSSSITPRPSIGDRNDSGETTIDFVSKNSHRRSD